MNKNESSCNLFSSLLIGVSSGRTDVNADEYTKIGIHNNHAFSILAVCALNNHRSRYVLVRDPHARSHYGDPYLTSEMLHKLQVFNDTPRSSGAFWISWSNFLRYFLTITISTYNEKHLDVRYEGQFTHSSTQPIPTYRFHLTEFVLSLRLYFS